MTRSVHLEIAYSLDIVAFLRASHRFTNHHGARIRDTSDSGTNFLGAVKEFADLVQALDQHGIQRKAVQSTTWHFNPPKPTLFAILSSHDTTDEDLVSAIIRAEVLMKSRPLSYHSSEARGAQPLGFPRRKAWRSVRGRRCR